MAAEDKKEEQQVQEMLQQYNELVGAYLAAYPAMRHQDAADRATKIWKEWKEKHGA